MALDRKLDEWQAAGLIEAGAAEAIRAYEAERSRPIALWATIGIGLFALALGVILVVAAGWDMIPKGIKLGVHLAMTAAAAAVVWQARRQQRTWLGEGALFLLAALVLAGIALQGQIYQLTSPVWEALAWWALLVTPAILIAGCTRLTAYGWAGLLTVLAVAYAAESSLSHRALDVVADNLPAALPPGLVLVSLWLGATGFANGVREAGLALLLAGASLAHFAWPIEVSPDDAAALAVRLPLAIALSALGVGLAGRLGRGPALVVRTALVAAAIATVLAAAVPHADSLAPRLFGAFAFFAMWGAIAKAAHDGGWRVLFGIAIAMIAVRLFIVYVELFGSLALTGIGLIVGGLLLIGLTLGWAKLMRRNRPA
jgi:uncharacterized membrane protein